eukprot:2655727-Prymnesium_polylepis.1
MHRRAQSAARAQSKTGRRFESPAGVPAPPPCRRLSRTPAPGAAGSSGRSRARSARPRAGGRSPPRTSPSAATRRARRPPSSRSTTAWPPATKLTDRRSCSARNETERRVVPLAWPQAQWAARRGAPHATSAA